MPKYKVAHRYQAELDSVLYSFKAGEIVDLSKAAAEHINSDSPDTLIAVAADKEAVITEERSQPPKLDRQIRKPARERNG